MTTTPATPTGSAITPLPDLERMAGALSHLTRWKMLRELSPGEPREISELATVAGCSYDSAIKHLGVLLAAGLVVRGRGKVFQIPKQYLPAPGERVVDYGHCLLRLDAAG